MLQLYEFLFKAVHLLYLTLYTGNLADIEYILIYLILQKRLKNCVCHLQKKKSGDLKGTLCNFVFKSLS